MSTTSSFELCEPEGNNQDASGDECHNEWDVVDGVPRPSDAEDEKNEEFAEKLEVEESQPATKELLEPGVTTEAESIPAVGNSNDWGLDDDWGNADNSWGESPKVSLDEQHNSSNGGSGMPDDDAWPERCHGCGKKGHLYAACPHTAFVVSSLKADPSHDRKEVCFECGMEGHFARSCTIGQQKQEGWVGWGNKDFGNTSGSGNTGFDSAEAPRVRFGIKDLSNAGFGNTGFDSAEAPRVRLGIKDLVNAGFASAVAPRAVYDRPHMKLRTCFNCNMEGHPSRDCPKLVSNRATGFGQFSVTKCYDCGMNGHIARGCPQSYSKRAARNVSDSFGTGGKGPTYRYSSDYIRKLGSVISAGAKHGAAHSASKPPAKTQSKRVTFSLATTEAQPSATSKFDCKHCKISFEQSALYEIHSGYHSRTNPFKCNRCGRLYRSALEFNLHLYREAHH